MVWALAVTETISYGVLYSSFAAFLLPMQHSLGFGQTTLTGAFLGRGPGDRGPGRARRGLAGLLRRAGADDRRLHGRRARLAYQIGESLEIKPTGLDEVVSVDLDRIRVTVEPPAEWTQIYHETWRLMRDNFWRAEWPGWTGPRCATATGRCSTASAPRMTCAICWGSCRARWAARTPGAAAGLGR